MKCLRYFRLLPGLLLSVSLALQLPALAQRQRLSPPTPAPRNKLTQGKTAKPLKVQPARKTDSKMARAAKTAAVAPSTTACPNTTPISSGQTINGTLTNTDCVLSDGSFYDVYTFAGSAGQQVAISMNSTTFDTFLFLLNPNESLLAQNDDVTPTNTNSRIPPTGTLTLPTTGTYSILANSFDPSVTGPYTVTLSLNGGTVCPPTPTPITNGQTLTGQLTNDDCALPVDSSFYDAYSFTANAGQQVAITMTSTAFDAYLILLAPDGADIAEDDDGGGGSNARIPPGAGTFATLPQTGTYIIYANSASAGQTGTYSINLSIAATVCTPTPIGLNQTVNGALAAGDCRLPLDASLVDPYTFNGTAGQQIAVTLNSTAFDAFLFLLSPTGSELAFDDNSGGGTNARIPGFTGFFTLPTTGTYTIYANTAASSQSGSYTLTLNSLLQAGQVVISELRFEGPGNGASLSDDFVELQNISPNTVDLSGTKLRIDTGAGVVDVPLPAGTLLQPGQHFLATNATTNGYTLAAYATGDVTYTADLNVGVALTLTDNTLIDQAARNVGTPIFGEGGRLANVGGTTTQNAYVRKLNTGLPQDTGDNATDFVLVATDPAQMSGAVLGAPGPENFASPMQRNALVKSLLIENCAGTGTATPVGGCQNRVRLITPDPLNPTLSTNGQLLIRRSFKNMTSAALTRLRFRITDVTTTPAPAGQADLRALSSQDITVLRSDGGGTVDVKGLTLDQPPNQPQGGGINSSLSAGTITLGTSLAPGASVAVEFRLGVVQGGNYRFFVNVEALP